MRNLILLLIGLAVGAVAATSVLNALTPRSAYPRGLMNVIQHHYIALREAVHDNRCAAAPAQVETLSTLSRDIELAMYPDGSADDPFREYKRRLDEGLAAAVAAGTDCMTLKPAVDKIAAACDACHRQYR
jgi:cytochrome c556